MPSPRSRRGAAVALTMAVLGAPGCATMGIGGPPPVGVSAPAPSPEEEERRLLAGADVHDDPDLSDYLLTVIDGLLSPEERSTEAPPIAVTVVRDPTQSAFALPTGRIFLHTGLLARVENEAQLATILARELGHLRRRPTLSRSVSAARLQWALDAIAPAIRRAMASGHEPSSPLSPMARIILGRRLETAYAAAVDGYGPAAAREADADALVRIVRAGYPPSEARRVIDRLRRGALAGGVAERFFYGNRGALEERARIVARLVETAPAAPDAVGAAPEVFSRAAPDAFGTAAPLARRLTRVRRDNVRLELGAGRFRAAREQLDRILEADPVDAAAHLLYGDLHRLRAQRARSIADRDELARLALARYDRSLAIDPGLADVHRQLGLLYYQLGRLPEARAAFARYVTRSPDAADVDRVREYLAEK